MKTACKECKGRMDYLKRSSLMHQIAKDAILIQSLNDEVAMLESQIESLEQELYHERNKDDRHSLCDEDFGVFSHLW